MNRNLFAILLIVILWCNAATAISSDLESLLSFTNATINKPSSWSPSNTDPCSWSGVSCSNGQTGFVTSIRINCAQSESGFRTDFGGVLNFTLLPPNLTTLIIVNCPAITGNVFQPVRAGGYSYPNSIQTIVITNNTNMTGYIDLTKLPSQLQYLDLSDNRFKATAMSLDLSKLPRALKNISLRGNVFFATVNFTNLPQNLTHVDFSYWDYASFVPTLVLSVNGTTGIPQSIETFIVSHTGFQTVDLANLTSLPISLQYLDVSGSSRSPQIIDLRHLPSNLRYLNLDHIFVTLIGDLNSLPSSLEQLTLYDMTYSGGQTNDPFVLNLCSLPSKLRVFSMSDMNLAASGGIIQGGTAYCSKEEWSQKQLQVLTISNSQWNTNLKLEWFPSSLLELHAEASTLNGDFNFTSIAVLLPNLKKFNIAANRLSGTISLLHPSALPPNLETFRISYNTFQGVIDFDTLPKSLQKLYIDGNSICSSGSTLGVNTTGSWCSTFDLDNPYYCPDGGLVCPNATSTSGGYFGCGVCSTNAPPDPPENDDTLPICLGIVGGMIIVGLGIVLIRKQWLVKEGYTQVNAVNA